MGSICSNSPVKAPAKQPYRIRFTIDTSPAPITQEKDIVVSPRSFVKRNKAAFYSIYHVEKFPLGSGARGEVRLCTHIQSKTHRVVKIITKSSLPKQVLDSGSVIEEVNILKELDHPNLPRVYEFFEDSEFFYIVLEYCKGGDLFDRIVEVQRFNESQAAEIMSQLLSGVNYLHSKGVIHRDLKPENVLMDNKDSLSLKIIDFDTATFFGSEFCKEKFGTAMYMAPEVVIGKYNEQCDLWSCGMILYILLSGGPPFDGTDEEIFALLPTFSVSLNGQVWEGVSESGRDLLLKLLEPNLSKRISAAEACMHPWITSYAKEVPKQDVDRVLNGIKSFKKSSKLKEIIHTFIISKIIDQDSFEEESKVFHLMDTNKDGMISKQELVSALEKHSIVGEEAAEFAEKIMQEVDSDMNGIIDYTEFLKASVRRQRVFTKENLKRAFKMIDQDGNGTIEIEELRKCFSNDVEINHALLIEIMNQADKNGDGKIDMGEFEELLVEKIASNYNSHELLDNIE